MPRKARGAMIERLKALVADARAAARRRLEADGNGRRCAAGLSHFQDELIRVLSTTTPSRTSTGRPTRRTPSAWRSSPPAAMAAGCWRPGSDIDLLFLLPYKKTPWGESVAEYMLYILWDLGFKVGHATRTVDQCIKMSAPTSPCAPRCSMRA